jgi:hypothetical protein
MELCFHNFLLVAHNLDTSLDLHAVIQILYGNDPHIYTSRALFLSTSLLFTFNLHLYSLCPNAFEQYNMAPSFCVF